MSAAGGLPWLDMGREAGARELQACSVEGDDREESDDAPGLANSGGLSGATKR